MFTENHALIGNNRFAVNGDFEIVTKKESSSCYAVYMYVNMYMLDGMSELEWPRCILTIEINGETYNFFGNISEYTKHTETSGTMIVRFAFKNKIKFLIEQSRYTCNITKGLDGAFIVKTQYGLIP